MTSGGDKNSLWRREEEKDINSKAPLLGGRDVEEAAKGDPLMYGATKTGDGNNSGQEEEKTTIDDVEGKEHLEKQKKKPHRPFCLFIFYLIHVMAILASLSLFLSQIIPLFKAQPGQIGPLQIALRLYVALFCLVFILAECEVTIPFLEYTKLLQQFLPRGFQYTFVGLVGMDMSYTLRISDMMKGFRFSWIPFLVEISSWLMVGVGVIYIIMGIFCLKGLRTKLLEQYKERLQEYREEQ